MLAVWVAAEAVNRKWLAGGQNDAIDPQPAPEQSTAEHQ
jgi:hypothetical protein